MEHEDIIWSNSHNNNDYWDMEARKVADVENNLVHKESQWDAHDDVQKTHDGQKHTLGMEHHVN